MAHLFFRPFVFAGCVLLLALVSCQPGGLSRDDANGPTGWAACENLQGGRYDLTGGARHPAMGVEGRKVVLVSDGGDMRPAIEQAIREYDVFVLDGSGGPFLYSESSYFDSLRNKTIVGIHGATLRTAFQLTPPRQEADPRVEEGFFKRCGIWAFRHGSGNLIIRNLFFDGPGAFRGKPDTMIRLRYGCDHVWIDHCTFEDPACLALGITKQSDCVTVSWCEFRFTEQSGGHSLGVLIASGDESWEDEDYLNVTFDHCLWKDVWSRIPMARFGTIHVLDNWFDCPGTVGINPRQNAEFLVEGCFFEPGVKQFCDYRIDVAPPKAYVFRENVQDAQFPVTDKGTVSVPYSYRVTAPERSREEVRAHVGPTLRDPLRIRSLR